MAISEKSARELIAALQNMNSVMRSFFPMFQQKSPAGVGRVSTPKDSDVVELLRNIFSESKHQTLELKQIKLLLTPPNYPNIQPAVVRYDSTMGDSEGWEQMANIPDDVLSWSIFNLSTTETIEVAYTKDAATDAIKKLGPRGEIFRDTRPGWVFCRRETGNTSDPYPRIIFEWWSHSPKARQDM